MNLLPVEPFQETLRSGVCAPATLKMLLTYWNLPGKEKTDLELAKDCGTDPRLGTSNEAFLDTARRFGLTGEVKTEATYEDVKFWLDRKVPVALDWFSPGRQDAGEGEMPDGHYAIAVGLDDDNIYLQDPEIGGLRQVPRGEFWRVWFDFAGNAINEAGGPIVRWLAALSPVNNKS